MLCLQIEFLLWYIQCHDKKLISTKFALWKSYFLDFVPLLGCLLMGMFGCLTVFTMKWVEESGNKSKLGNIMYLHILGWFAIMTESEYSWECFCGCLHHICSLAFLSGCIEITHISHPTKATWRCMYDWNKTVNVHCTKRICGMFAARKYPKMYAFDESMSLLLQEE